VSSPTKIPPVRLVLLAIAAIWLPIKIGQWGGVLLNMQDRHENLRRWVAVEEGTHGLLAVAVCLPLFWNRRRAPYLLIPFLLATAPDFDHLLAAKERVQSVSAEEEPRDDLEYVALGTRGFSHSLVITYIAAGILFALTQRLDWAWVLAMARTSHIIRDAHTAPLAIYYPHLTLYELELWPYLYWHAALGAMTFGVMFIYQPVRDLTRRAMRGGFGVLWWIVPRHAPSDWEREVSSVPARSTHRRSHGSAKRRHRPSSRGGEQRQSPSGRSEHLGHSGRRSHSRRKSPSSRSSYSSHSDTPSDD
jgi:membrane-bound metal-dependent hydrolase YbcI (DUF457 family)